MMTVPFGTDVKVTLIPKIGEEIVPKETIKHLKVCIVRGNSKKGFTPIYKVGDAGIEIEIQRHHIKYPGVYKIILDWRRPDAAYYDGYQDISNSCSLINFSTSCKVVNDNTADIEISPIYKGDKGDKGDPFTYDDFTPEQIEDLKRPAIEAAESVQIVENQISINEQGRVQAENERETAETTRVSNENNRVTAEQERVQAESLRATAESSRELAESLRVEAELLRQSSTQEAISNAENATENANTAAQNADNARLAIQSDLALKADQADLVQLESDVEQLAYVKIKNEAVNGNFENGLIEPFKKTDGFNGESTLAINSSTPISGNYDVRFTVVTPSTSHVRPFFQGLNRAGNIGDKIYLHFYAKILSGTPRIGAIHDGKRDALIYGGDVINGRNTRIIDVAGINNILGYIYFSSPSVWDMQMDNFMRINLTEAFGAGNEPTEEEMNLLLDILGIDFFEGEITVPAQKIMQWQLALIRKNKNAIIALGGTII